MPSRDIDAILDMMSILAPAGYICGLHVRQVSPAQIFSTLPKEWERNYDENSYYMRDPTLHWAIANNGVSRWADIRENLNPVADVAVLDDYATFGLKYGASTSVKDDGTHSISSFFRNDRDFTDDEIEQLLKLSKRLHSATNVGSLINESEITAIRMKVDHSIEDVAKVLEISTEGVRKKLKRAYKKLGVSDLPQAVVALKQSGLL